MAEENKQETKDQHRQKGQNQRPKTKQTLITGSIMVAVILIFALSGFLLAKVLIETLRPEPMVDTQVVGASPSGQSASEPKQVRPGSDKTWFYDLDPMVANLNEPGATRYVSTTLTLEISESLNEERG